MNTGRTFPRQEINLYLEQFRPKLDLASAANASWIIGGFLVLLLLSGLVQWYSLSNVNASVKTYQEQEKMMQRAVADIKRQLPQSQGASLQKELESVRQDIAQQEHILQIVTQQNLGSLQGFSEYLRAFSLGITPQISLHSFQVENSGKQVFFSGQASVADAVPRYIQALQQVPVMVNAQFGVMSIEKKSQVYQFALGRSVANPLGVNP